MANQELADFQWENRILVFSIGTEQLADKIKAEKTGIADRDLKIFMLSGEIPTEFQAGDDLEETLKARLSVKAEERTVYLIGKDGKTVLRWSSKDFTFEKLYASIDAMPMRLREIREKRLDEASH